ncbi:hypothetical protein [Butyrivibrio sp. VCB2006]|uniref:hypothetical protein n=1 Tax=Butyrivibrio sp. VCB2006 TaxID=1280679 RepID=UPI0004149F00|nr:hypothetical protein [Butyrivibrio sp. VCB2006]
MDFGFLASANSITNKYLNQLSSEKALSQVQSIDDDTKKKFGKEFEEAYDSMMATRALNESMRSSYEFNHQDSLKDHATRLGYSIDNRVIDMLHIQLSDDMNAKVNSAMNSAIKELGESM